MRLKIFLFLLPAIFSIEITLLWPPDLAQTLNQTPEFRFKVVDNSSTSFSCTLYIDNLPYGENDSVLNDTETVIVANNSLSFGDHTWYINCTDGENYNVSETRTIGVGQNFSRCAVLIDNNTIYYLSSDIIDISLNGCINISSHKNITLNCQNHILASEKDGSYGIYVENSEDIIILDCRINSSNGRYVKGVGILNTTDFCVSDVFAYNQNVTGVYLMNLVDGKIVNLTCEKCYYGISYGKIGNANISIEKCTFNQPAFGISIHNLANQKVNINISNSTLKNCTHICISIRGGGSNTKIKIINNTIVSTSDGMEVEPWNSIIANNYIKTSTNKNCIIVYNGGNTIVNNTLEDCWAGIALDYEWMSRDECNNTVENNTLDGLPILYKHDGEGEIIQGGSYGEIYLCNFNNTKVKDLFTEGIYLTYTENVSIKNLKINSRGAGIFVRTGININISGVNISSNAYGIYMWGLTGEKNVIKDSRIKANYSIIYAGDNITIYNNIIDGPPFSQGIFPSI